MRAVIAAGLLLAASVGAVAGFATSAGATSGGRDATTSVVCRLQDSRIDEASGIARGIRSPGVLYIENDSGDVNRFFAIDRTTCATAAVVTVPNATNVDWEDLAVAPDAAGTPSVWLADIGDNDENRREVAVYRIAEPRIAGSSRDRAITAARTDQWRLRYPDGAHNAESFAVTPAGVGYIVTKSLLGGSEVFELPARPDRNRVQTLQRVGAITFGVTGTDNSFGLPGELTATGAAFDRDGAVFAVRTYSDAYFWSVADGDLAAALTTTPKRVPLPEQNQGEGIALDGARVLLDSEGVGQPVLAIVAPRLAAATGAPSRSRSRSVSPSRSPSPSRSLSPSLSLSPSPSLSPTSSSSSSSSSSAGKGGSWLPGLVIIGLAVVGAAAWWIAQLRRPAR